MQNILDDLHQYSDRFTIGQVITFFARKGFTTLTRAMIQNYVRDGVLRPPLGKRYYTHKHVATLALIQYLKPLYEIADLRDVLTPHMDEEGISVERYTAWASASETTLDAWRTAIAPLLDGDVAQMLHSVDVYTAH